MPVVYRLFFFGSAENFSQQTNTILSLKGSSSKPEGLVAPYYVDPVSLVGF